MDQPQGHLPHEHEAARAHQREVLRCAVIVAMARQAELAAFEALYAAFTSSPSAGLDMGPETRALIQATAELEAAVDQLTNACVDATIASKAGGN